MLWEQIISNLYIYNKLLQRYNKIKWKHIFLINDSIHVVALTRYIKGRDITLFYELVAYVFLSRYNVDCLFTPILYVTTWVSYYVPMRYIVLY